MGNMNEAEDLEALFDSIQAESQVKVMGSDPSTLSINADVQAPSHKVEGSDPTGSPDMFHRVGALTRQLHDALRELGLDKGVECAVDTLRGDARSRLDYIAKLTGEAAEKALTAVEKGQKEQEAIAAASTALTAKWDRVFAKSADDNEFKATVMETRAFLKDAGERAGRTNEEFTAIMMAQDFHDLTGQVIQRIVKLAETLESNLVKLLIEATPPDQRCSTHEGFLTGPAVATEGRTDVVTSQAQVDDLLESLGF